MQKLWIVLAVPFLLCCGAEKKPFEIHSTSAITILTKNGICSAPGGDLEGSTVLLNMHPGDAINFYNGDTTVTHDFSLLNGNTVISSTGSIAPEKTAYMEINQVGKFTVRCKTHDSEQASVSITPRQTASASKEAVF